MEDINDKWMFNRACDGIWSGEKFNTREEAIKAGQAEYAGDTREMKDFFVGQVDGNIAININTDNILDNIAESVYEQVGEVSEDYLGHVEQEDLNELESELSEVVLKWMKKHGYEPNYYKIVNTEAVPFKEEN